MDANMTDTGMMEGQAAPQPEPRPELAADRDDAPQISLRNVTKSFRRGELEVEILHGISLDVRAGEFVAIMGASGSGKSTLMNLLGLLDRPTGGSYRLDGEEVTGLSSDRRAILRRERFGFIFQQYNLLAGSTASENVEMPAVYARMPAEERRARAAELLTALGLGDRLDHRPSQLSGGQQQRVSIARALMNGGAVILADEPTGALDSRSGVEVMRLLRELNERGHTVILITHDPAVARQAKRIVEIRDGNIVSDEVQPGSSPAAPFAGPASKAGGASVTPGDVAEAARMAVKALRNNLMRTLLTLLGIIIGVASVVAMLAIGNGARQEVMDRIGAMGTNLLLVRPGAPNVRPSGGQVTTLVAPDAEAIAGLPNVAVAVPEYPGSVTMRRGGRDYATSVNATTQDFPQARGWTMQSGAFFEANDVRTYAPVAVIGQTVARALYAEGEDPIGSYLLMNSVPFQVIGVLAPKGATPWGADQDDIAYVPLTTGTLRLFGQRYVRTVTVQVEDVGRIAETEQAIRDLLTARHQAEDFQIRNMASVLETATATQNSMTLLLGSIAAISLLVGGIGVMNIMLVSVTERTREIGVRMATGARRVNIMLQFNSEALAICTLGGLIGVGVGLGVTWLFAFFGKPVQLTAAPVILAFGCAFGTGLLFGYLPARKAADLDPVVALASE
ncbi:MacB family efflux pump subunit [Azospirillum sp. SYSU D00513]|uniref:MacB family efflux pump subunit n=1 Tax=Azospirillum sp. SYSU D00513 TaxID=2812561 RepID=UPI001FFEC324|nr:MacB family efflux pump subunit [Azospirillum sp. SYSU D00513]